MSENTKIIASPSLIQIAFGIISTLFPSGFVYLIYSSEIVGNDQTTKILYHLTAGFFILAAILSFIYMIVLSKKITLTNDLLEIYYPILFHTKKIYFEEIKKVSIKKYNIKSSHDFSTNEIYSGTKIVMELYESKNIEITSFEVSNYKNLAENLKNVTTSYFKIRIDQHNKTLNDTKIIVYFWLFLACVLTFGLFISVFKNY